MFKTLRNSRKANEGFSLVELLVVLLIMSVIAGIAVPLYLNQKQRSYLSLAQSDATAMGQEITSIVADYTSFGTTAATITIASGALVFGAMAAATGSGTFVVTGPATTQSTVRLSPGSSLTGSTSATAGLTNWCIVLVNNGTFAKYSGSATGTAGITASQVGGTAPTCVAGV